MVSIFLWHDIASVVTDIRNQFGDTTMHAGDSLSVFNVSIMVATASLIFAIATYWTNEYRRKKEKKVLLSKLDQEMKSLYKSLCVNILKYKTVCNSGYLESFTVNVYNAPILIMMVESGKLHQYIHHNEGYSRAINIYTIVKLLDNCDKTGFSPPIIPKAIDWFFEKRLLVLYDDLIALYRCRVLDTMIVSTDRVRKLSDQVIKFLHPLDKM